MFDTHFVFAFFAKHGGKWVSVSEVRPNGDASAKNI